MPGDTIGGLTPQARALDRLAAPLRLPRDPEGAVPPGGGCDEAALIAALDAFAATTGPAPAARLGLENLRGFLALTFARPTPELDALAAEIVRDFDGFRAPMSPEDRARRQPERLEEALRRNLDTWGYPYVMEAFRFHMTLTERLDAADAVRAGEALRAFRRTARAARRRRPDRAVPGAGPGAPFTSIHAAPLIGAASKTA
ncbi:MAG: DUF1045 domain-containing protein [Alphaproteobacteria bacterium]|nr:DUF1045 domain-containing protein [Alphaproteobacteria bacterium]